MGEANYCSWDPLLVAVHLAHLDFGPDLGVLNRHSGQGDVLGQDGGPNAAGHHSHLVATYVDAVAVGGRLLTDQLQTH